MGLILAKQHSVLVMLWNLGKLTSPQLRVALALMADSPFGNGFLYSRSHYYQESIAQFFKHSLFWSSFPDSWLYLFPRMSSKLLDKINSAYRNGSNLLSHCQESWKIFLEKYFCRSKQRELISLMWWAQSVTRNWDLRTETLHGFSRSQPLIPWFWSTWGQDWWQLSTENVAGVYRDWTSHFNSF